MTAAAVKKQRSVRISASPGFSTIPPGLHSMCTPAAAMVEPTAIKIFKKVFDSHTDFPVVCSRRSGNGPDFRLVFFFGMPLYYMRVERKVKKKNGPLLGATAPGVGKRKNYEYQARGLPSANPGGQNGYRLGFRYRFGFEKKIFPRLDIIQICDTILLYINNETIKE